MQHRYCVTCADANAMSLLGRKLSAQLPANTLMFLSGELGAGKSHLARAIIHAAGFDGTVKSPTYTLIETYEIDRPVSAITRVAHLDLYRLSDPDELHYIGFDDVLANSDLVLIEWPEKSIRHLPVATVSIEIEYAPHGGRVVRISSVSELDA